MLVLAAMLMTGAVVVSVAVALFVRSWSREESEREARLCDPRTHTIAYAIPSGVDPVVFAIALDKAGFASVSDRVGSAECIRVECSEAERGQVRSVLESVQVPRDDRAATRAEQVVFEDER